MKKFLILLFVLAFYFQGEAQPKINRAPAPAAAVAPVKPKGPIPYLLKKDFDEILTGLKADISKLDTMTIYSSKIHNGAFYDCMYVDQSEKILFLFQVKVEWMGTPSELELSNNINLMTFLKK